MVPKSHFYFFNVSGILQLPFCSLHLTMLFQWQPASDTNTHYLVYLSKLLRAWHWPFNLAANSNWTILSCIHSPLEVTFYNLGPRMKWLDSQHQLEGMNHKTLGFLSENLKKGWGFTSRSQISFFCGQSVEDWLLFRPSKICISEFLILILL